MAEKKKAFGWKKSCEAWSYFREGKVGNVLGLLHSPHRRTIQGIRIAIRVTAPTYNSCMPMGSNVQWLAQNMQQNSFACACSLSRFKTHVDERWCSWSGELKKDTIHKRVQAEQHNSPRLIDEGLLYCSFVISLGQSKRSVQGYLKARFAWLDCEYYEL